MAITSAVSAYSGTKPTSQLVYGHTDPDIVFIPFTVTFDSSYDGTNGEAITASTLGVSQILDAFTCGGCARDSGTGKAYPMHATFAADGTQVTFRLFSYNGSNTGEQALDHLTNAVVTTNVSVRVTIVARR